MSKEPLRIWLDAAFRAVVDRIEAAQGVDPKERLGIAIGSQALNDPRVVATGPRFRTCYTSGKQPMRGGGYSPLRPPDVPAVPDGEQLKLLLEDHSDTQVVSSPAERRVCAAHQWLTETLRHGRIRAWAREWIEPRDPNKGENVCTANDREIERDRWGEGDVDYRYLTLCSHSNNRGNRVKGHLVRGQLVFDQIAVDEAQLLLALQNLHAGECQGELRIGSRGGSEMWTLVWNEQTWQVGPTGTEVPSRGMCAIALLLRSENTVIPYHLLQGLRRKPGHTNQKDQAWNDKLDRLHREIDSISKKTLDETITVPAAVKAVRPALQRFRSEVEAAPGGQEKIERYNQRVRESVKKSISEALKLIRRIDESAASFLKCSLKSDRNGFKYTPGATQVIWTIVTKPEQ